MRGLIRTFMSWLATRRNRDPLATIKNRLTDRARTVMKLAEQEARRVHHEYLGTEHLLFGLANDRGGIAAAVMQHLTGDLGKIRWELNKVMMSGPERAQPGILLLTPRLRTVLDAAGEEARSLNHNFIGTEHLLLGLLRDPEGLPATVFRALGVDANTLRVEVLATLKPSDA